MWLQKVADGDSEDEEFHVICVYGDSEEEEQEEEEEEEEEDEEGLKVTCRWGLQFEKRDETTKAGGVRVVCALRFFLCTNVLFKKRIVGGTLGLFKNERHRQCTELYGALRDSVSAQSQLNLGRHKEAQKRPRRKVLR